MVRQTRYLLVGNIPEKITKEKITEHFKNYGKIQNVKFHPKKENELGITATVAFMDIKCASKAYSSENKIENVVLRTEYSEGAATGSVVTRPVDPGLPTTGAHRGQYLHARGPSTSFTTRTKGSLDEDETYREYYYPGSSSGRENSQFENRYPTYDEQVQHQSRSYQRNRTSFSKQYERGPQRQKSGSGSVTGVVTGGVGGSSVTGVGSSNTVGSTVTPSGGGAVVGSVAVGTSSSVGGAGSGAGTGGNSGGGGTNNGGDTGSTGVSVVVSSTLQKHSFDERYHEQYGSDRESFERPRISTLSPTCSISQASSRHSSGRRKGSVSVSRSSSRSRSRSSSSSEYSRSSSGSSGSRSHSRSRASSRGSLRRIPVGSAASQKHSKSESQSMMSSKSSTAGSQSERKPLGICVTGLPLRSSDTSLRDGLFHEYKKHGKVTSVQVLGQGEERYSVVSFRKPEDAAKALEASQDKMFFGKKIKVMAHEGVEVEDNEFRPPEAECDEYHPKATRTLFVGNLEKEITTQELRDRFKSFGEIIDIDIKRQGAVSAYAFVQYADITSVVKSLRKMEGEHIGANKIKLGFGKSMPTNCVWLDNLSESVTEKFLCQQFGRYGEVSHAVIDRYKGRALIYFTSMDTAQYAVNEMRNRILKKKRVQTGDFRLGGHLNIDFASRDCQTAFFEKMERTGQLQPGERPDERGGRLYRHNGGTNFEYYDSPATPSAYKEDSARYETGTVTPVATTPRVGLTPPQFSTTKRSRAANFQASSTRQGSSYRGRHFSENTYSEEFPASQRQRHIDEYSQGSAPPYAEEDSYEQELREYGYSQRERRERGNVTPPRRYHSPYREDRHSNADKESTRGSRYEEAFTKDRYEYYSSDSAVSDNGHDENWVDHHTLDLTDRHATPTKLKYSSRSETRLKQTSRDHSPAIEFSYRHSPVRRRSKSRSRSKSGSRTESPSRSRSRTPLRERRKESVFRPRSPHTPQTPPTPTEEEPPIYSKIRPISPTSRFDEFDRTGELKKICRTEDKIEGLRPSDHEKAYSMKCLGTPAMSFMKGETTQARKKSREFDESKHDILTGRLLKSQVPTNARLIESALQDRHQVLMKKADELHDKNRLNRRKLLDQPHGSSSHSSGHDSDPGSFAETDLGHLHREKRLLLEKLKQLEDAGSPSDNDSLPTHEDLREDGHGRFVPRKGRSDDPLSLRHSLSDLHAKEKRKLEPSQSFRKQMEARRLLEQTQGEASLLSKSKKCVEKVVMLDNMDSEGEEDIGITSPKAIPTAFKPKRKKKLDEDPVSGVRTGRFYRMKKSGMMSSDDEKDHSKSLEAEEPVMRRTSRESKDELSAVISRFKEQSRHSELSREVSESGSHKESREYKMVHMTSKDGMETGTKIIKKELSVDDVVQDPRHEIKKEEPLSLPLPRFALKHNTSPVESPLPCPSPPLLPVGPKARSPCFSPQCSSKSQSPAMSPAGSLSDVSHDTANSNLPESGLNRLHEQKDDDQLIKDLAASSSGIKTLLANPDGEDNLSDSLSELSCSSLDEKIRQLDKKLNMTPVPRPVDTTTPGLYGKFKIKKKETPMTGGGMLTPNLRSEPSDIVKSLLSRSSIFDQDSKRLEQINEKYKPKEININIEDSPPKMNIRTKAAAKEMPPTMPQNFSPLMPYSSFSATCNITSPFPPFTPNVYPQHPVIGLANTPSTPQFWGASTPAMSSPTKPLVDVAVPVSVLKKTPLTPAPTELSVRAEELPQVVPSSSPSALPEISLPPVRQPVDTPLSSHTSLVSPCLEQAEPAVKKEPAVPLVTGKNEVAGWMSPRKDLKIEEMSEVDPKEKRELLPGPVSTPSTSSGSCLGKRKSSDDLDSPRNKMMKTESKSCPLVIKPQEIPKNESFDKIEAKEEPVLQPRKKAKHSESTKPKEDKESEKKSPGVPSVKPSKSPEKKLVKTPSREKNEKKEPAEGEKKEVEKKTAEIPPLKKDQKGSKDGDKSAEKCKSSGKELVCDLDEKAKLKNSHSERKHEKSEKKEKNRSKSSDGKSDKERSSKDGEAKESHKKDKLKSKADGRSKSKSEDKGDADASKNGRAGHEKVEAENLLKASKSHRKSEEDKGDDKTDTVKCSEVNKSAKSHHRLEQPESEASTKNNKTHHKADLEKSELEISKGSKSHHKADNDKAEGEGMKSSGKSHQKSLEGLEKIEVDVPKNKCGKVEPEKAETENSKTSKSHHKYECDKGEADGTKPSSKSHHKHDQLKSETDGLKSSKMHHKSDKSNRSSSDRTRKDSVKSSSERKKSEKDKTDKTEKQEKSEKVDKLDKDNKSENKDKLEKAEKSEKEKFDKEKSEKTEKEKSDKEKSDKVEKAEKDKSEKEKSDKDKDKTEKEKQDKSKPDKEKPEKEKPDKDKQEKPDKDRQEKPEKEKPDKSEKEKPDKEKPDRSEKDRSEKDKSDRSEKSDKSEKSESSEKMDKSDKEKSEKEKCGDEKKSEFCLDAFGPYVSMYDKVKRRSCSNKDKDMEDMRKKLNQLKNTRKKRGSKPSRSDETESSVQNTDDESSTSTSFVASKKETLTEEKDETTNKKKKRNVIESSSSEEDPPTFIPTPSKRESKKSSPKTRPMHKKSKAVLEVSSDSDIEEKDYKKISSKLAKQKLVSTSALLHEQRNNSTDTKRDSQDEMLTEKTEKPNRKKSSKDKKKKCEKEKKKSKKSADRSSKDEKKVLPKSSPVFNDLTEMPGMDLQGSQGASQYMDMAHDDSPKEDYPQMQKSKKPSVATASTVEEEEEEEDEEENLSDVAIGTNAATADEDESKPFPQPKSSKDVFPHKIEAGQVESLSEKLFLPISLSQATAKDSEENHHADTEEEPPDMSSKSNKSKKKKKKEKKKHEAKSKKSSKKNVVKISMLDDNVFLNDQPEVTQEEEDDEEEDCTKSFQIANLDSFLLSGSTKDEPNEDIKIEPLTAMEEDLKQEADLGGLKSTSSSCEDIKAEANDVFLEDSVKEETPKDYMESADELLAKVEELPKEELEAEEEEEEEEEEEGESETIDKQITDSLLEGDSNNLDKYESLQEDVYDFDKSENITEKLTDSEQLKKFDKIYDSDKVKKVSEETLDSDIPKSVEEESPEFLLSSAEEVNEDDTDQPEPTPEEPSDLDSHKETAEDIPAGSPEHSDTKELDSPYQLKEQEDTASSDVFTDLKKLDKSCSEVEEDAEDSKSLAKESQNVDLLEKEETEKAEEESKSPEASEMGKDPIDESCETTVDGEDLKEEESKELETILLEDLKKNTEKAIFNLNLLEDAVVGRSTGDLHKGHDTELSDKGSRAALSVDQVLDKANSNTDANKNVDHIYDFDDTTEEMYGNTYLDKRENKSGQFNYKKIFMIQPRKTDKIYNSDVTKKICEKIEQKFYSLEPPTKFETIFKKINKKVYNLEESNSNEDKIYEDDMGKTRGRIADLHHPQQHTDKTDGDVYDFDEEDKLEVNELLDSKKTDHKIHDLHDDKRTEEHLPNFDGGKKGNEKLARFQDWFVNDDKKYFFDSVKDLDSKPNKSRSKCGKHKSGQGKRRNKGKNVTFTWPREMDLKSTVESATDNDNVTADTFEMKDSDYAELDDQEDKLVIDTSDMCVYDENSTDPIEKEADKVKLCTSETKPDNTSEPDAEKSQETLDVKEKGSGEEDEEEQEESASLDATAFKHNQDAFGMSVKQKLVENYELTNHSGSTPDKMESVLGFGMLDGNKDLLAASKLSDDCDSSDEGALRIDEDEVDENIDRDETTLDKLPEKEKENEDDEDEEEEKVEKPEHSYEEEEEEEEESKTGYDEIKGEHQEDETVTPTSIIATPEIEAAKDEDSQETILDPQGNYQVLEDFETTFAGKASPVTDNRPSSSFEIETALEASDKELKEGSNSREATPSPDNMDLETLKAIEMLQESLMKTDTELNDPESKKDDFYQEPKENIKSGSEENRSTDKLEEDQYECTDSGIVRANQENFKTSVEAWSESGISGVNISPSVDYEEPVPSQRRSSRKGRHRERKERKCRASRRDANKKKDGIFSRSMLRDGSSGSPEVLSTLQNFDLKSQPIEKNSSFDCYQFEDEYDVIPTLYPRSSDSKLLNQHLVISNVKMEPELISKETSFNISKLEAHSPSSENKNVTISKYALKPKEELDEDSAAEEKPNYLKDKNLKVESESSSHEKDDDEAEDMADPIKDEPTSLSIVLKKEKIEGDKDREEQYKVETIEKPLKLEDDKPKGRKRRLRRNSRKQTAVSSLGDNTEKPLEDIKTVWTATPASAVNTSANQESSNKGEEVQEKETDITALAVADLIKAEFPDPVPHTQEPLAEIPPKEIQMEKDSDAKASLPVSELEPKKSVVPMREYPKRNRSKTSAAAASMTASNMQVTPTTTGGRRTRASKYEEEKQVLAAAAAPAAEEESASEASKMKEEPLTAVIPEASVSQPVVKLPAVEDKLKEKKVEIPPIRFQRETNRRGRTRGFTLRRGPPTEEPTENPPVAEETAEKTFQKAKDVFDFDDDDDEAMDTPKLETVRAVQRPERHAKDDHLTSKLEPALSEAATPTHKAAVAESQKSNAIPSLDIDESTKLENQVEYQRSRRGRKPNYKAMDSGVLPRTTSPRTRMSSPKTRSPKATRQQTQSQAQVAAAATTPAAVASSSPKTTEVGSPVVKLEKLPLVTRSSKKEDIKNFKEDKPSLKVTLRPEPVENDSLVLSSGTEEEMSDSKKSTLMPTSPPPAPPQQAVESVIVTRRGKGRKRKGASAAVVAASTPALPVTAEPKVTVPEVKITSPRPATTDETNTEDENPVSSEAPSEMMNQPSPFEEAESKEKGTNLIADPLVPEVSLSPKTQSLIQPLPQSQSQSQSQPQTATRTTVTVVNTTSVSLPTETTTVTTSSTVNTSCITSTTATVSTTPAPCSTTTTVSSALSSETHLTNQVQASSTEIVETVPHTKYRRDSDSDVTMIPGPGVIQPMENVSTSPIIASKPSLMGASAGRPRQSRSRSRSSELILNALNSPQGVMSHNRGSLAAALHAPMSAEVVPSSVVMSPGPVMTMTSESPVRLSEINKPLYSPMVMEPIGTGPLLLDMKPPVEQTKQSLPHTVDLTKITPEPPAPKQSVMEAMLKQADENPSKHALDTSETVRMILEKHAPMPGKLSVMEPKHPTDLHKPKHDSVKHLKENLKIMDPAKHPTELLKHQLDPGKHHKDNINKHTAVIHQLTDNKTFSHQSVPISSNIRTGPSVSSENLITSRPCPQPVHGSVIHLTQPLPHQSPHHEHSMAHKSMVGIQRSHGYYDQPQERSRSSSPHVITPPSTMSTPVSHIYSGPSHQAMSGCINLKTEHSRDYGVVTTTVAHTIDKSMVNSPHPLTTTSPSYLGQDVKRSQMHGGVQMGVVQIQPVSSKEASPKGQVRLTIEKVPNPMRGSVPPQSMESGSAMGIVHERMPDSADRLRQKAEMNRPTSSVSEQQHKGHHGKSPAALSLTMSQSGGQQRVWKQSPPPQQLIRHIAISPSPSPTLHATNLSVGHQQVSHQGGAPQQQQQQQQPLPPSPHSAQSLTTHQLLSGGQQQHLARSSPNMLPGVHPGSHGVTVSSAPSSVSSSASVAVTTAHSVSQIQHQLQAVNAAHQREREREPAPNQSPAHQPSGHQAHGTPVSAHQGQSVEMRQVGSSVVHRLPYHHLVDGRLVSSSGDPKTGQPSMEARLAAQLSQPTHPAHYTPDRRGEKIATTPSAFSPPDARSVHEVQQQQQQQPQQPPPQPPPQTFYPTENLHVSRGMSFPQGHIPLPMTRLPVEHVAAAVYASREHSFLTVPEGTIVQTQPHHPHYQHGGYLSQQHGIALERVPIESRPPSRPPSRPDKRPPSNPNQAAGGPAAVVKAHVQQPPPGSPGLDGVGVKLIHGNLTVASQALVNQQNKLSYDTIAMLQMIHEMWFTHKKYQIVWQGFLALKNDNVIVQMHLMSGNRQLIAPSMPQMASDGTMQPLRISQRMRLEPIQVEGVAKRMQLTEEYCMLLALPNGRDHLDILHQTRALSNGFISYLSSKQAAGIVNVANPESQQPAYVVHIFPPCEFSRLKLREAGFELMNQVTDFAHLVIVITTV